MKDFKCELISWEDMYELSRVIAGKIREDKYRPDVIIAMARGGYVPARNLCDLLIVKNLLSLKVDHWGITANKEGKARIPYPLHADIKGKNVLLVDDLSDTGESFKVAVEYVKSLKPKTLKSACVYLLEGTKFVPSYYAARRNWKWFVFPWNFNEDMVNLVSGLYEENSRDKKSLAMIQEELDAKHGVYVREEKLKPVLEELAHRRILKPYLTRGLVRWMPW